MPFICTLDEANDLDVDIIEGNGEFIIRLAIGFDDISDETFSLAVALSPAPGGSMELVFNIVSYCQRDDSSHVYWDGRETRNLFAASGRSLIRSALMVCVRAVIEHARPETVCMTTHAADLPHVALVKFWEINRIFAECGYDTGRADGYHGRYVWMMLRKISI